MIFGSSHRIYDPEPWTLGCAAGDLLKSCWPSTGQSWLSCKSELSIWGDLALRSFPKESRRNSIKLVPYTSRCLQSARHHHLRSGLRVMLPIVDLQQSTGACLPSRRSGCQLPSGSWSRAEKCCHGQNTVAWCNWFSSACKTCFFFLFWFVNHL